MDIQAYLDSLEEDYVPEDYSAAGDTTIKSSGKQSERVHNLLQDHRKAAKSDSPFSNDELAKFINYVGFKTDEVPKFSELAKRLNTAIRQEPVEKDLTNLDKHDTIKDVEFIQKNNKLQDDEVRKLALQRLMAKFKGK